jgi:pectate lyase
MGFAKVMPTVSREIYYDARSASLVIGAADITRLDIIGVDGRRVNITDIKSVGDARVLDMSSLRAGVYIVRFSTPLGLQTMKFVKN